MKNGTKNIGVIDRTIRAMVGISLISFAWSYDGPFIVSTISAVVSIAILVSALTGFCFLVRIKTNVRNKKK